MINPHSLKPFYCLNNDCSYYIKGQSDENARHNKRWILFKRYGKDIVSRCASCGKLHRYNIDDGKLQMIDNRPKKVENKPKLITAGVDSAISEKDYVFKRLFDD